MEVWEHGRELGSVIASAPTKLASLNPIYNFFASQWPFLWFRVGFAVVGTVLIYVFDIVNFARACYGFHARALHMRVTMMQVKAM